MEFGLWDESIQMHPEQKVRIARALSNEMEILDLNNKEKTASIKGSGVKPYNVTLEYCTCGDYIRRKLPCKHMYRLALELGEIYYDEIPNDIIGTAEKQYIYKHVELLKHPLLKKSYSYSIRGLNTHSNRMKTIILDAYDNCDAIRRAKLEGLAEPFTINICHDYHAPSDAQMEAAKRSGIVLPDDVSFYDVSSIFDRLWNDYPGISEMDVKYVLDNDIIVSPYSSVLEAKSKIQIYKEYKEKKES